ncbi:caspase family protein [Larkinella sp.]|uniref:caspase family protein n=1 Tax=Larkinella sp. TaxID=2034517 RepID=UPI003BAC31C4
MGTNSNQLVFATWWKESLQLWDIALNKSVVTIPITSNVCKITYTPNDRYVLVQGFDNLIEIRDAKTLKLIQTLDQVGFFTDANFKAPKTPDGLYEIYPYFRSVFLKKVAGSPVVAALPKTAQPPTISWELPGRSDETVASNAFGVKACITGDGITAHQLYLNGEPVSLRGFKRLGCPLGIDQVLTLRIGPNELYLTATTAAGTVSSERRYVTYQPPAPSPLTVQTAPQQKRLALVIGNARYQHAGSLANPVNDALALKAVLEECGFTVLYYADLDKKGMVTAFQEFGLKLKAYNVGLVFYAGHGLSIRGMNYFLPTDANPQSEDEVEFEGIPTTRLIRKMEEANRLTNIILFDACRDNPFARTWGRGLGDSGGFALLPPPKGTLIAYAASDGEAARDRAKTGTNSPFTKALVKYIRQGGLSLSQILQRVRTEVENETAERQTTQDVNMMRDDFYFR